MLTISVPCRFTYVEGPESHFPSPIFAQIPFPSLISAQIPVPAVKFKKIPFMKNSVTVMWPGLESIINGRRAVNKFVHD